jgi:hypothetical protein
MLAQQAAQTPTAPAPAQAPAAAPAAAAQGGGRGRGGVAGPGPALGGEVDETPVVTHHSINVDGREIKYTATVAQMPLKNASGETEAHIFYMAYTLDGVTDVSKRPVTFCFNGGPGSASMWVHMGGMGPRSPKLQPNGGMPQPPYQLKDNQDTWLDRTDLVFIDPVGTGYSRAKTIDVARRMNGVQGDIQSVGEFMRMYVTRNNREVSPLFIAGESYGTFRAAGLGLSDRPGDGVQRDRADRHHAQSGDDLEPQRRSGLRTRISHLRGRCLLSQEGGCRSAEEGLQDFPEGSRDLRDDRLFHRAG